MNVRQIIFGVLLYALDYQSLWGHVTPSPPPPPRSPRCDFLQEGPSNFGVYIESGGVVKASQTDFTSDILP